MATAYISLGAGLGISSLGIMDLFIIGWQNLYFSYSLLYFSVLLGISYYIKTCELELLKWEK